MNALLAVNHFLNTKKYNELHTHLINSAAKKGIELKLKTNLELAEEEINADFVLFWDKDINLARRIERKGIPVFNSSQAIALCDDKARTFIELEGIVSQPETLIAPKCYFKCDMSGFVDTAIKRLGLPLVFKECFGSFGKQVYLCRTRNEILNHISERPFILQRFIKESLSTDIRLEIVGGRCVSAVRRINENDFRSNVTSGGSMQPYSPTESEIKTAVCACEKLGLTFGGVDILSNGMLCEVNSNAHIINIMNTNGIDIAPLIFDEIEERLK